MIAIEGVTREALDLHDFDGWSSSFSRVALLDSPDFTG
jgi:hypothetical protein